MLKGLEGVTTHEHREWIPILENDQDMPRLAGQVRQLLAAHGRVTRSSCDGMGCTLGANAAAGGATRGDRRVPARDCGADRSSSHAVVARRQPVEADLQVRLVWRV